MSQAFLTLAMLVAVSIPLPAREPPSIKRLDRSTITSAEVDETVSRLMKAAEVTGVGIAIFNDGKVAFSRAYGFRDKDQNLPLTVASVVSATSFSWVMQLIDESVLDLDKPIDQYLPKPLPEYERYGLGEQYPI